MTSVQAMPRLKTRVNPEIPPNLVPLGSLDILVKVRIDEDGNVVVNSVETANVYIKAAMRDAVEKWKFNPFTSNGEATKAVVTLGFDFRP